MEKFYLVVNSNTIPAATATSNQTVVVVNRRNTREDALKVADMSVRNSPSNSYAVFEYIGEAKVKDSPIVFVEAERS